MQYYSDEFGFSRPDVSRVASRQLKLSAALLAIVGFATLGVTFAARPSSSVPAATQAFERPAVSQTIGKVGGTASTVRPG